MTEMLSMDLDVPLFGQLIFFTGPCSAAARTVRLCLSIAMRAGNDVPPMDFVAPNYN